MENKQIQRIREMERYLDEGSAAVGNLARALEDSKEHKPVFSSGRAVLAGLTVEEIAALSARWAELRRESDPGLELSGEELEKLKKNSAPAPVSGCGGGC